MKKLYYLISVVLFPLGLIAQPTVMQSDLPTAGSVYIMGVDTSYIASIPAGGANQVWNYGSLLSPSYDTAAFINSTGTPYIASFPGSSLATYNPTDTSYTYFTTNSSGLYVNGAASPSSTFVLNPGELNVPVPFTYNDTRTNVTRLVIDTFIIIYQIRVIFNITSVFTADGFGSLNLPNGTFTNILRIKDTQTTYDSTLNLTLGTIQSTSATQKTFYRWYKPGAVAPFLLGIDADSLGQTSNSSQYLVNYFTLDVPGAENKNLLYSFPNPASDRIMLTSPGIKGDARINVYNSFGQLMKTATIRDFTGLQLDVADYPDGKYFYSILSGEQLLNGNFTVLH